MTPPVSGSRHTLGFFICRAPNRAILFVDGNNWYHGLRRAGVVDQARLDHAKIAAKLVGPRTWIETRYYIGQVSQSGNSQLYADQRVLDDLDRHEPDRRLDGRSLPLHRLARQPSPPPAQRRRRQTSRSRELPARLPTALPRPHQLSPLRGAAPSVAHTEVLPPAPR